jgi:hypothetical protein
MKNEQPEAVRFTTAPSPEPTDLLEPSCDDVTRPDARFNWLELPEDWDHQ